MLSLFRKLDNAEIPDRRGSSDNVKLRVQYVLEDFFFFFFFFNETGSEQAARPPIIPLLVKYETTMRGALYLKGTCGAQLACQSDK